MSTRPVSPIFKKLNLKDQTDLLVVNAPASFEEELGLLAGARIYRDPESLDEITFALLFVTRKAEIDRLAAAVAARAPGDPLVWFAYPKGSSKKYTCDVNRDTGWEVLGPLGFEGVRQVAIDEDWSALRFRRVENIRSMQRDPKRALTAEGRKKARPD